MLIRFWRSTRDEDGQAIVIAAIGLLVVAMVVLATATLGNAIHEKVRLQNAADAAAYSTAAVQARAFNFYSFTNRTMVSHYAAIMLLQSYLVVATFIFSAINTVLSVVNVFGAICAGECQIGCDLLELIPKVGPFIKAVAVIAGAIDMALGWISDAIRTILWGTDDGAFRGLDYLVGWVATRAFVAANWILYLAQLTVMSATTAFVVTGGRQVIDESYEGTGRESPEHGLSVVGDDLGPVALFNQWQWARAHDANALNAVPPGHPEALLGSLGLWNPEDWLEEDMWDVDPGVQRAQRIMTEISNATRPSPFVYNRSLDGTMVGSILDTISDATAGFFNLEVHGETKMITPSWPGHDFENPGECNDYGALYDECDLRTGATRAGRTYMPQGGSIVADQWMLIAYRIGGETIGGFDMTESEMGINFPDWVPSFFANIFNHKFTPGARQSALAATHRSTSQSDRWGWHCSTHLKETKFPNIPGVCVITWRTIDDEASDCDRPEPNEREGGNHPWWGVTPFVKFNPSREAGALKDFHQPNVFVWLHQPPEQINRDPMLQQTLISLGGWEAEIDTSVEADGEIAAMLGPGFHAIARAMAYYHRPGNWNEHPNFFNPFWRAKLEPVAPVLAELADEIGIGVFGQLVAERIITH